jgi:YqaJ-like viral recombinase domain
MINEFDKVDGWFLQRYSKFTASEIYKLLGKGKDGTGFSAGGMTYIETKAIEEMTVLYEKPELDFVESLMHGKMYEEPAYRAYVKASRNTSMRHFGTDNPVYLPYNDYSGGSPDGLMGEGENIMWGLEIKCPKNPANHFKYLKFKDQWCLKESRPEYYAQIQFLLMITEAEGFHFVSYDERFKNPTNKIKIIDVMTDTKFQDNLQLRIASAQKEKIKILEKYN